MPSGSQSVLTWLQDETRRHERMTMSGKHVPQSLLILRAEWCE